MLCSLHTLFLGGGGGSEDEAPPGHLHALRGEGRRGVKRPSAHAAILGVTSGGAFGGVHVPGGGDEGQPIRGVRGQQPHSLALIEGQSQAQPIAQQEDQELQQAGAGRLQELQGWGGKG